MITIYDIAEKTGYSIATISKVINNYQGVSEKAKLIINKAIEETGFTPSHYARALATQRSYLIGILFSDEKGLGIVHPNYSRIIQSFQVTVGKYGYDTIFLNNTYGDSNVTLYDKCKSRGVDGVVLAGSKIFYETIKGVIESDIPKVSVETMYPNVPTIISDNRMGTLQALEHLYMLGHRKIAHINCMISEHISAKERHEAYLEFMTKKGLEMKPNYLVEAKKYTLEAGTKAIQQLLNQCWDDMPTAIYASYDEYVVAAVAVLKNQGFRIPEDISIVGFDDLPLCEYVTPAITTIHQNREMIGKEAAQILCNTISGEEIDKSQIIRVPTTLVVRQTTRKKGA